MRPGLANWFKLWHPRYRLIIIQLLLAGTLAACLVYAQNFLLTSLTQTLIAQSPGSGSGPLLAPALAGEDTGLPSFLRDLPRFLGVSLPVGLLLLFIFSQLLATVAEFWNVYTTGKLRIQSRTDLEAEVLMHLLGKDDAFFTSHSPSETVNRISLDLYRVCERRCITMRVWWAVVLILGNLMFFLQKDWRLALLAVGFCLAAALWAYSMTRGVKHLDKQYLYQDDSVKSRFEDFLRAAPEIQVGSLAAKVRRNFAGLQGARAQTYMGYVKLSGTVHAGNLVSALLALVGTILVVMYAQQTGAGSPVLALLPVVIMSLPTLFKSASELVTLNLDFQLAHTSMLRLLEYDSRQERAPFPPPLSLAPQPVLAPKAESVPAATLRLEGVTYLYGHPDHPGQGVVEINTAFPPGRWIAIAGQAGCGKSTLAKLLVGRLRPQNGRILYGDTDLAADEGRLSRLVSFMPQSLALLHATIYENLFLGRVEVSWGPPSPTLPSPADLEVIEAAGLGRLCRLKALDLTPRHPSGYSQITTNLADLRRRAQTFFGQRGLPALPPGEVYFDQNLWVLEILLGGKCHRSQAVDLLLGKGDGAILRKLDRSKQAPQLLAWGKRLLNKAADPSSLADLPPKSGFPGDDRLGQLRLWCAAYLQYDPLPAKARAGLYGLALTAPFHALDGDALPENGESLKAFREAFTAEIKFLQDLLGGAWQPFEREKINAYLTWRENLAFGVQGPLPDQVALDFIEEAGLQDLLTRQGLEFDIGRLGGNLSGGQGQLVALCRALLRRTPVLVLDEPTSSLDPLSKTNVARFLRTWKNGRIVITVSHDPEFVAWADEIILMEAGGIVTQASFSDIAQSSALFQRVLREG